MFKLERKRYYKGIAWSVVAFIVGQVLLNWVAPMEDPPMGNTIYIVLGSTLSILAILAVFMIIKELLKLKKREKRRKNNPVLFLDDEKSDRKRRRESR